MVPRWCRSCRSQQDAGWFWRSFCLCTLYFCILWRSWSWTCCFWRQNQCNTETQNLSSKKKRKLNCLFFLFFCRVVFFLLVDLPILVGMQSSNLMVSIKRKSRCKEKQNQLSNLSNMPLFSMDTVRYAELDKQIKNSISHRSKALDVLKKFFADQKNAH